MKQADRRRLEKLVTKWAPRLGLQEWQFDILHRTPRGDRVAETVWDTDVRAAELSFSDAVVGRYDEEHTVVHELLHCATSARAIHGVLARNKDLAPLLHEPFEELLDDTARYLLRLEESQGP